MARRNKNTVKDWLKARGQGPKIKADPGARIEIGGKRVLMRADGSLGARVPSPEDMTRAKRRAANKRAKLARRKNRG